MSHNFVDLINEPIAILKRSVTIQHVGEMSKTFHSVEMNLDIHSISTINDMWNPIYQPIDELEFITFTDFASIDSKPLSDED